MPKSNIGFLVCQPIISYMPDHWTTDAQFTTLCESQNCYNILWLTKQHCTVKLVKC